MKIIGHRGAKGLGPENNHTSIRLALKQNISAIEIDVRQTLDGIFVLCHDDSLLSTYGIDKKISQHNYSDLSTFRNFSGEILPRLDDVLIEYKDTEIYIEAKSQGWSTNLAKILNRNNNPLHKVISFNHQEVIKFQVLSPTTKCLALTFSQPMKTYNVAVKNHISGIVVYKWLLNPVVFWMAKKRQLEVNIYTVNSRWQALLFKFCYSSINLISDFPDRLCFLDEKKSNK